MATETHTTALASVNTRSYFIVFVNDTGKILSIKTSPLLDYPDGTTQIETKNPICRKIAKGTASLKKYGMVWDIINEKWDIDIRSTTLVIESNHNKLIPFVKDTDPTDTEIFVRVYYDSRKIEVEANRKNIASIKNLSDITEISTTEVNILDIFVTRKNDPDYLINIIKIDPATLFKTGRQTIRLKDSLSQRLEWSDISLYAKSVFNNYGWSLVSDNSAPAIQTNKILQYANVENKNNININVVNNVMNISSKLTAAELYYFSGKDKLKLIVCDEHIDKLVGAFELSVDQLLQETSELDINFSWPNNPLLLYKNNYLKISTGEIK